MQTILVSDEQVAEVAELTNIVGGGIKSLLPSPSVLSLPTVTQGTDFHLHVHWSIRSPRET